MKILHFTEQERLKEDELPSTIIKKIWDQPVKVSTWEITQGDKHFPKLAESDEKLVDGICAIQVVGGQPGVRFAVVNRVIFLDGSEEFDSVWVYVFRNPAEANRLMIKPKKPDVKTSGR